MFTYSDKLCLRSCFYSSIFLRIISSWYASFNLLKWTQTVKKKSANFLKIKNISQSILPTYKEVITSRTRWLSKPNAEAQSVVIPWRCLKFPVFFLILQWFCDKNKLPGRTVHLNLCDSSSRHGMLPAGNICEEGGCMIFTRSALEHVSFSWKVMQQCLCPLADSAPRFSLP